MGNFHENYIKIRKKGSYEKKGEKVHLVERCKKS